MDRPLQEEARRWCNEQLFNEQPSPDKRGAMTPELTPPVLRSVLWRACSELPHHDRGSSLVECALLLPVLILLLLGSVDLGRAWYISLEVASAAEAGALYGVQNPTDTAGMMAAAALDAPDISNLSTSASYGTQCSDGTSITASNQPVPTCSVNAVTYVLVGTTMQYKPYLTYPGMGSTWTLSGNAKMRTTQ